MNLDVVLDACRATQREVYATLPAEQTELTMGDWQRTKHSRYRNELEPFVFSFLQANYGPALDTLWQTHTFPKQSKRAFVIVERRCHPNWWFLLRNLAWAGPEFSLYIFCSDQNIDFLTHLLGSKCESVHLIPLFKGLASKAEGVKQFNLAMTNPEVYAMIDAEYCITVQLDTYFVQKIPEWIFQGDYYGAPWGWEPQSAGGGGMTLRKISTMKEICSHGPLTNGIGAEDKALGDTAEKCGFTIPPFQFRLHVFLENLFLGQRPIGIHQWWTFIDSLPTDNTAFRAHLERLLRLDV